MSHKLSKVAAVKKNFPSLCGIVTAYFDECFLFYVIIASMECLLFYVIIASMEQYYERIRSYYSSMLEDIFFIQIYRCQEDICNRHVVTFLETSVLKEVRDLDLHK